MERGGVGPDYLTFSHWDQLSHLAGDQARPALAETDPVWAASHWD